MTTCCAVQRPSFTAYHERFLFGSVADTSGREVRHQGLADLAVDRLRLRRDRHPARRRGDPARRSRRGACASAPTARSIRKSLIRFSLLSALSTQNDPPQAASKPFSKNRDGFVMAEGAGALVLESYDRAEGARREDPRRARGLRRDGRRLPPHPLEPRRQADHRLHRATRWTTPASRADDIDYVNAHGTGTPENDKMECLGSAAVFGERMPRACRSRRTSR